MPERGPPRARQQFSLLLLKRTLLSALLLLSGPARLCLHRLVRVAVGLLSRPDLSTLHVSQQEEQQVRPGILPKTLLPAWQGRGQDGGPPADAPSETLLPPRS